MPNPAPPGWREIPADSTGDIFFRERCPSPAAAQPPPPLPTAPVALQSSPPEKRRADDEDDVVVRGGRPNKAARKVIESDDSDDEAAPPPAAAASAAPAAPATTVSVTVSMPPSFLPAVPDSVAGLLTADFAAPPPCPLCGSTATRMLKAARWGMTAPCCTKCSEAIRAWAASTASAKDVEYIVAKAQAKFGLSLAQVRASLAPKPLKLSPAVRAEMQAHFAAQASPADDDVDDDAEWEVVDRDSRCRICLDKPSDMVMRPCNHLALCIGCWRTAYAPGKVCPVGGCKHKVTGALQIYF